MQAWEQGAKHQSRSKRSSEAALVKTWAEFLEQLHEADGRAAQGAQSVLLLTQQGTATSLGCVQLAALE